jgi:hypothetical protein
MLHSRQRKILLALMLSVLFLLACGGSGAAQPTPPGGSVKVSQAAAEELEKNVRNQIFNPTQKDFRLTITNQQITSYINLKSSNLPLDNPQIWFTQGKAFIRGSFTFLCFFHPEVLVVAAPKVKDNRLIVNVQQIYVGAFQLPQDWLATASKSVTDTIDEAQINLNFEKAEILEGEFVITGSKRVN